MGTGLPTSHTADLLPPDRQGRGADTRGAASRPQVFTAAWNALIHGSTRPSCMPSSLQGERYARLESTLEPGRACMGKCAEIPRSRVDPGRASRNEEGRENETHAAVLSALRQRLISPAATQVPSWGRAPSGPQVVPGSLELRQRMGPWGVPACFAPGRGLLPGTHGVDPRGRYVRGPPWRLPPWGGPAGTARSHAGVPCRPSASPVMQGSRGDSAEQFTRRWRREVNCSSRSSGDPSTKEMPALDAENTGGVNRSP